MDITLLKEAVKQRHSVRKYTDKPIKHNLIVELTNKIEEINEQSHLHIQLVINEPKAFYGIKSYGQFHGVNNYIVMIGKKSKDLDRKVGYYGEQLVLFAQILGLNTCWVGLTYSKVNAAFQIKKDEKVACVISLGYGETLGVSHKVKTIEQVSNFTDSMPIWFKKGVEAALLAPTAVNQQKFRFEYYFDSLKNKSIVRAKKSFSLLGYTQMDLGIAQYHFEIGAGRENFEWSKDSQI